MHPDEELERWTKDRRQRIDQRLAELIPRPGVEPSTLHEAMRYAVLGGGKRLRPLLCLAAYEAAGGHPPRDWDLDQAADPDAPAESPAAPATAAAVAVYGSGSAPAATALDLGCALELIHAYSLIHDDLPAMDDDDLRRGRLATHKAFGEAAAILAGDALLTLAFGVAAAALPGGRARQAVMMLAAASGSMGMAGGQMLDLEGEGQPPDAERIEAIDRWKTGALFACACELGAYAAGADAARQAAMRDYGRHLGAVFQIVDDLLDVTGSAQRLGKTPGKDRQSGKQTLVAVHGPEEAARIARRRTDEAVAALSPFGERAARLRRFALRLVERKA